MAKLSDKQGTGLYNYGIKVAGAALPNTVVVIAITVHQEINRIPYAEITMLDGDAFTATFDNSDGSKFDPGKEIEVSLGRDNTLVKVFSGIITRHSIKSGTSGASTLTIEAKAKAIKMTISKANAVFQKKTDKDIMLQLINNHGLTNSVSATSGQFPNMVQYQATDWDFLLSRAEVNGMIVWIDDTGKVIVEKPKASAAAKVDIKYGEDVLEFDTEVDVRYQYKDVKSTGWDYSTQKAVKGNSAEPSVNSQGSLTGSKLAKALSDQSFLQFSPVKAPESYIKSWSDSQLMRARLSRIKGNMTVLGVTGVMPGDIVKLDGFGGKFNGSAYVSAVTQRMERDGWTTQFGFGIPSKPFSERNEISVFPASGMLPAVSGLQVGIITSIEDDSGDFQVKVKIPYLDDSLEYVARLSHLYATNGSGTYFMPEVNDEVILGFMNDDPNLPIVLGSMYSSKNKSPETPEKDNKVKAIVTKSKMKISFQEEDKIITIETPGKNMITISDKDKSIVIQDQNNNKMELGSAGITLDSAKDVVIKAQGKVSVTSQTEIGLKAQTDVKIAGLNVQSEAQVKFSGKGNAQAEVVSSGQTVVKGSIVMIN